MAWEKIPGGTGGTSQVVDALKDIKLGVIGSSSADAGRTQEVNFFEQIANRTGLVLLDYADGGSTLTSSSADYSSETTNQLKRIDELPTVLDAVVCQPCANDQFQSRPLGTFTDTGPTTVYGALHMMCQKLIQKYPVKPLGVLTPQYFAPSYAARTNAYHTAIKEVCSFYGIPVCDLWAEGRTPYGYAWYEANYIPDGTHLNDEGNLVLSRRVEAFIRQLFGGASVKVL